MTARAQRVSFSDDENSLWLYSDDIHFGIIIETASEISQGESKSLFPYQLNFERTTLESEK